MPKARDFLDTPQAIVHAYNRGIDRRKLFHRPRDYELCLQMFMDAKIKTGVSILAHTLMPNHVHLVLQQHEPFAIADFMQRSCFAFSRWSNKRANRTGPLFDGPYGSTWILDAPGLVRVVHYVHTNAVHAGLVRKPTLWKYSGCESFLTGSDESIDDCAVILALVGGPEKYAEFLDRFDGADPESVVQYLTPGYEKIWDAITAGKM